MKALCGILEAAHVDHCLIGGIAVGILAKPRSTEELSGRPQDLLDIASLKEK